MEKKEMSLLAQLGKMYGEKPRARIEGNYYRYHSKLYHPDAFWKLARDLEYARQSRPVLFDDCVAALWSVGRAQLHAAQAAAHPFNGNLYNPYAWNLPENRGSFLDSLFGG
jgi:hypothetical protein